MSIIEPLRKSRSVLRLQISQLLFSNLLWQRLSPSAAVGRNICLFFGALACCRFPALPSTILQQTIDHHGIVAGANAV